MAHSAPPAGASLRRFAASSWGHPRPRRSSRSTRALGTSSAAWLPPRENDNDDDARIDTVEDDELPLHAIDDETSGEDARPSLVNAYEPSSMGLSFLLDPEVDTLNGRGSLGRVPSRDER